MNIIIFLIILLVLVISHEWGHFIVAKKSGIRVDEFAFGFPPRIATIKKGETNYSINALPLGGYVKIFGENPDEESLNGPDSKRSFVNKPWYIQAAVLLAGVAMNFIVAWLLLSFGFVTGLPSSVEGAPAGANVQNAELAVTSVAKNSPAEIAGLKIGDRILHLSAGKSATDIPSTASLQYFISLHPTEKIDFTVKRANDVTNISIIPNANLLEGKPGIGVSIDMVGTVKLPIHKALWEGLKLAWSLTKSTAGGFFTLIHDTVLGKANLSALSGPVGIVGIVGDAAKFGFVYLLSFTAIISINLAVINLIPFPALDGGRLLFLLIEKIKGSRIKPEIANLVNIIGFGLLMLLMAIITYHDIAKLFVK